MLDIDKADRAELKAYARDELGLSLTMNMNEETMRAKIKDRLNELGKEKPAPITELGKGVDKSGWVVINIQRAHGKSGGEPVFVGYNGKGYTIPRGVNVPVPPPVEAILRNAIRTDYEQDVDENGDMESRDVVSYPYQIISGHENRVGLN